MIQSPPWFWPSSLHSTPTIIDLGALYLRSVTLPDPSQLSNQFSIAQRIHQTTNLKNWLSPSLQTAWLHNSIQTSNLSYVWEINSPIPKLCTVTPFKLWFTQRPPLRQHSKFIFSQSSWSSFSFHALPTTTNQQLNPSKEANCQVISPGQSNKAQSPQPPWTILHPLTTVNCSRILCSPQTQQNVHHKSPQRSGSL